MKTKKDKNYSFIHVNERLSERYNLEMTSKEFDMISTILNNTKKFLIDIDSNNQEIHKMIFKNKEVIFVFNKSKHYITTVLKEWEKNDSPYGGVTQK